MNASYHTSNFGAHAPRFATVDRDGYIHTTPAAVMAGEWDGEIDADEAEEIAAANADAVDRANRSLDEWREANAR